MKTIEKLLIEDAAQTLPENGFAARVLCALPAPAPRLTGWKPALILGSTALGSALAFALAPAWPAMQQGLLPFFATALTLTVAGAILAIED